MTRQQQRITGGHLAHRSQGVTTLHHYERISSRDLEWHRWEKRKRKRRGKTKLLLWKTSETKEPWDVEQIERKNATETNEVESTPLRKRNKKEPIRVALQLKRDERLDKMKELEQWAHTPVKRISMKRSWSSQFEMMTEKSNITKPPEEMKEWNGKNEGKQDLGRTC